MEKYLGVKIIQASPCKGYNNKCYNDNNMYPTNSIFEDGYKIIYPDGYESWSPKDVFEKAYKQFTEPEDEIYILNLQVDLETGNWHIQEDTDLPF